MKAKLVTVAICLGISAFFAFVLPVLFDTYKIRKNITETQAKKAQADLEVQQRETIKAVIVKVIEAEERADHAHAKMMKEQRLLMTEFMDRLIQMQNDYLNRLDHSGMFLIISTCLALIVLALVWAVIFYLSKGEKQVIVYMPEYSLTRQMIGDVEAFEPHSGRYVCSKTSVTQ